VWYALAGGQDERGPRGVFVIRWAGLSSRQGSGGWHALATLQRADVGAQPGVRGRDRGQQLGLAGVERRREA
jgi:hypothetical protein